MTQGFQSLAMQFSGSANGVSMLIVGVSTVGGAALGQQIRFENPVTYLDGIFPADFVTVDLDRDGDQDVVVPAHDLIRLYFNDGSGDLSVEATIPLPRDIHKFVAADFDADGLVDLAWPTYVDDEPMLAVWYNDGSGRNGEIINSPIPSFSPIELVATDYTGNGLPDVLVAQYDRTISLVRNEGNRVFSFEELFTHQGTILDLKCLAAGDLDGDGDTDVVATFQDIYYSRVKNVYDTRISLLINDGPGPLRLAHESHLSWNRDDLVAFDMNVGDVDGDGDLDVAVCGGNWMDVHRNEISVLRNDAGQSTALAASISLSDGWPCSVVLSDVNADGRLDLAFVNDSVQGVYVLRNDGDFAFTGGSPFVSGLEGRALKTADMNGDGQVDLLQCGPDGFSVLFNSTAIRNPRYNHTQLTRGQEAVFVVSGAEPGEEVRFLYSTAGAGNSLGYAVLGGIALDVLEPFAQFGVETVRSDGRAVLRRTIPPGAPLGPVTTQAVIRRGPGGRDSVKTPFRTAVISN